MKALFWLLWYGFIPKWKIIKEVRLDRDHDGDVSTGTRYYLQCEQTGWVKKKDCV